MDTLILLFFLYRLYNRNFIYEIIFNLYIYHLTDYPIFILHFNFTNIKYEKIFTLIFFNIFLLFILFFNKKITPFLKVFRRKVIHYYLFTIYYFQLDNILYDMMNLVLFIDMISFRLLVRISPHISNDDDILYVYPSYYLILLYTYYLHINNSNMLYLVNVFLLLIDTVPALIGLYFEYRKKSMIISLIPLLLLPILRLKEHVIILSIVEYMITSRDNMIVLFLINFTLPY